ncbi:retrotransposon protein, putative, ty1-copia subclass [Tanacetum coccineum]
MAQPDNNNTLSSAFKTFFEREKLTGDNFNDWYRSLRIVLRVAGTYDYLFKPCPEEPPEDAAEDIKAAWKAEYKIHSDVACLMLGRMSPALQRQFELYFPQAMLDELRRMFEKPKAVEIYDLVDTLHSCKQAPGKSISAHVLEMKGYMDQLQALGKPYDNDMAINLINRSLNKDFGDFIRNFNMHCVGKTVLAIQKGRVNKPKPQANKKGKGKVGHWKRNCPLYLEELRTNKNKKAEHGTAASGTCRLAHIGKTRMQKLQREGLLESINDESYEKCESCISGKMTKKPFNNNIERATYLLGLIHTDVCGPLRHVSRKGASYFLTFTDDFSRYGYKIKALRSDRGGEYLSQEVKEYLGKNGIVQHLTSPYTPQQNGVFERRNHTLLDMVRSMFNLTTLPLSFWDYALESEFRILNMVPTKKVDKTPYETWQGYPKETYGSPENKVIIAVEPESLGPPPELIPVRRDLGEPANYKAAMLDLIRIDYEETFSPVADIRAIRILIAIAAYYDYDIWRMDVKLPFMECHLDEDIYMEQPEGYVNPKYPNRVCKLQRSIYGLKQASRQWNKRFDEEIKKFGFTQNRDEPCVYRKASGSNRICFECKEGNQIQNLMLHGFCDASWQCDKDDTKSQTGYVFVVNGGAVDWKSKKQTTIAMSAAQAEYMAASEAAMEAVWIRKFVGDLGVMPSIKSLLICARHFLRRYHYVREQVESGEIKILKVHTDDNLADPFTKALPRGKVTDHANGIGLQLASSFMHTCD